VTLLLQRRSPSTCSMTPYSRAATHHKNSSRNSAQTLLSSRYYTTSNLDRLTKGKPIEIRTTPDRGRGIFATRDLAKGQTLWREKPLVSAWHSGNVDYCWTCFLPLEEPTFSIPSDPVTKKNLKTVEEEDLVLERNKLMQDLQIPRFDKTKLIVENESMNIKFCSTACKHEAHENYKPLLNALRMKLPPIVAASEMGTAPPPPTSLLRPEY